MPDRVIPASWLPPGRKIHRVIVHWTGGVYTVSGPDKAHYHAIIGKDGVAVKGYTPTGWICAHTRNLNSGSYGLSIAAMAGAQEGGPYGKWPMTELQWERAAQAAADVVHAYDLRLYERTVLCHQEVTYVYGPEATPPGPESLRQRGKWDVSELPWERKQGIARSKEAVWAHFRAKVQWYLREYHGR